RGAQLDEVVEELEAGGSASPLRVVEPELLVVLRPHRRREPTGGPARELRLRTLRLRCKWLVDALQCLTGNGGSTMVWPPPRGHGAKSPPPVRELHAYPWRRAVSESIVAAAEALCQSLRGFDPELYSGSDCAAIVEKLAGAEKLSSSVRVRAALRAADCGAHRA